MTSLKDVLHMLADRVHTAQPVHDAIDELPDDDKPKKAAAKKDDDG